MVSIKWYCLRYGENWCHIDEAQVCERTAAAAEAKELG